MNRSIRLVGSIMTTFRRSTTTIAYARSQELLVRSFQGELGEFGNAWLGFEGLARYLREDGLWLEGNRK